MKKDRPGPARVNTRRAYIDGRYGQTHLRTAFPSTGGFDERTALVCLHRCPGSSRSFGALLGEIGGDRSVYAPDTPGFGESDPPPGRVTVADYAGAIGDLVDMLRLREVDLLGHHDGSAIAAELAIARPELVRRLVCIGLPAGGAAAGAGAPPPPAADGSHLPEAWRAHADARGAGVPLGELASEFTDRLQAGPHAGWGAEATAAWPAAERLKLVTQPTLVVRPRDPWWDSTARARAWLRAAEAKDFPDQGPALLSAAPALLAAALRRFLDR